MGKNPKKKTTWLVSACHTAWSEDANEDGTEYEYVTVAIDRELVSISPAAVQYAWTARRARSRKTGGDPYSIPVGTPRHTAGAEKTLTKAKRAAIKSASVPLPLFPLSTPERT
jgi:hypothetical protein